MANKSFRIKKSITVEPLASPTLTEQGEISFDSTSDKLKVRNVGSTDSLVQEAGASTLTNKTIDADSNTITNIENADIKSGAAIDAAKIADGSVSSTEFQYINSLTSNAQTQINSKITSGAAAIVNADINASAAISASKIADGSVDNTEFQRLGAVTSAIVGLTDTQTLTNKTLTSPVMSSPSVSSGGLTLAEVASPSTPSSGNGIIYFKSDGFLYQKNDDGTETKVGAGSGGINYISANPDFESSTTGWATYKDTPPASPNQGLPVDGTGGTPTLTLTRSTSSPLRGTASGLITTTGANLQGEGASYDFTISNADQGKVLSISFDYTVASGTYADGDMTVYIYDVTNALVIQPAGFSILNVATGFPVKQIATFQTASNSTSYRLLFHRAVSTSSAMTMRLDNVICGPQIVQYGAPITDPIDYTPTLTNFSATINKAKWFRRGDRMVITAHLTLTGAASGNLTVSIPSGYSIDTTKIQGTALSQMIGTAEAYDASANQYTGTAVYDTTTTIKFIGPNTVNVWNATTPFTWASTDVVSFVVEVPIAGFSSSVVMSDSTDTRVVSFTAHGATATVTGSDSDVTWSTVDKDTHGQFNGTTTYTIPSPGEYRISASLRVNGTYALDNTATLKILKTGSVIAEGQQRAGGAVTAQVINCTHKGTFVAGDTIKLQTNSSATAPTVPSNNTQNYVSIERLSGPSAIAASESVNCCYTGATTSVGTTAAIMIMPTNVYDSHNAYNSSTGIFTAPISGKYRCTASASANSTAAGALDNAISMVVRKNSTNNRRIGYLIYQGSFTLTPDLPPGSATISLLAGETVDFTIKRDAGIGAFSLASGSANTYIMIERVGN